MKQFFILLFFCLITVLGFSQEISVNQKESHKLFIETLRNSKDLRFEEILTQYDNYIEKNSEDIAVKIYRCKFIGNAYYDEYEDYNLKYDETIDCINNLYENYPNNPAVLLYKLENTYEGKEELIDSAIEVYSEEKSIWKPNQIGKLYEIGAKHYAENNDFKANIFAKKAVKFSDSLDLSILLTNVNIRLGNNDQAKESLMSALDKDHDAWILNQKAKLLLELDEVDEALKMFNRVKNKDSSYTNNGSLYNICLKNENYERARGYLLEDTLVEWSKTIKLQKLLSHDIIYSDADTALSVYRRMQDESFYDDFFGIKRLRIFFKAPFKPWKFSEVIHIVFLSVLFTLLFVVPYLWVLPVFGASKFFDVRKIQEKVKLPVDWTLKHFWLISFAYLCSQTILILVFYYQDNINYLFDVVYAYAGDEVVETNLEIANSMLVFTLVLFISTALFLNKKRLKYVFSSTLSFRQIIGFSVLFLGANGFVLKILGQFVDITEAANYIKALSAKEEIAALLSEYGFLVSVLVIAIIVPFYEEIIFRGIILASTEKHIGFKWANVIQASLFATVHFSLNLFVFYLCFGLVTGYAAKRTKGLFAGFVFHAINNFVVIVSLYYVTKAVTGLNY